MTNAPEEENYYNSESEGKEYKDFDERYDAYIQATCEETFGKENCHEETYNKEKNNQEETWTYIQTEETFTWANVPLWIFSLSFRI